MSDRPGYGESYTCANCYKEVLGEGSWGITPYAICRCENPRRSATGFGSTLLNANAEIDHLKRIAEEQQERLRQIAEICVGAPIEVTYPVRLARIHAIATESRIKGKENG